MKKTSLFTLLLIILSPIMVYAIDVIPSGEATGIIVMTDGVLITDTAKVTDQNGRSVNPAHEAGLKSGDLIIAVNGKEVCNNEDLSVSISNCTSELNITVLRDEKTYTRKIKPVNTKLGKKIGLLVRDSTAGIGTITFIEPNSGRFGGLGHAIIDLDTNDILPIKHGNILKCNITPPTKGEFGTPGSLNGDFSDIELGTIAINSNCGIFGKLLKVNNQNKTMPATSQHIKTGKATILSNIDGNGVKEYEIEIEKISHNDIHSRNMVIKVTDKILTEKTGGIVQGMSGSPIIQNGKLIGAVTHVFVNDPTRGYGIFIENMLVEAGKTN